MDQLDSPAAPELIRVNVARDRGAQHQPHPRRGVAAMIRSIFFPVLAGEIPEAGLNAACELAREHDAHLIVVVCISAVTPIAAAWSTYPMAIYDTLAGAAQASGPRLLSGIHDTLSKTGVSYEAHVSDTVWLTTSEIAAVQARYCDITVFGRVAGADARMESGFFSDLLLQSGRPLLMVPAHPAARAGDTAVVGWKPTREATRALHDAQPLLKRMKTVQVVVVAPRVGDQQHGQLPGTDIAAHLARHGLRVELVEAPRLEDSSGSTLLRHAREQGAALLVVGGYGHRRMRESVFGGVTRTLFEEADMPVLFSH
jgi:nucleotide-binding universal stress UspA family protein